MLSIILLIYGGKAFYTMANRHGRNGWAFAILGLATFFVGMFLGGLILGIAFEVIGDMSIDDFSDNVLGYMAMPFGVAICWGTYKYLEKRWASNAPQQTSSDILDSGL